jgi:hypothetical protein
VFGVDGNESVFEFREDFEDAAGARHWNSRSGCPAGHMLLRWARARAVGSRPRSCPK